MKVSANLPVRTAIYTRASKDRFETFVSVSRQEKDCRAHAKALGWKIVKVYEDDDESAFVVGTRDQFNDLLDDIKNGDIDAVVVYHLDRFVRHPMEFEQFIEVCKVAGVTHFATARTVEDLDNDDHLNNMRVASVFAKKSSDDTSRRCKRAHKDTADAGRWKGGPRPYGYQVKLNELGLPLGDGRLYVVRKEAKVIKDCAERSLAGETLYALVKDLNDRKVPTANGGRWYTATLKAILTGWVVAGKRSHKGEVVADACWPAILDDLTHRRLRSKFENPEPGVLPAQVALLAGGRARCGKCGHALHTQRKQSGARQYACMSQKGGCGGLTVTAEPVEALLVEAILVRLDTPALWQEITRAATKVKANSVAEDQAIVEKATADLKDVGEMWRRGEIDKDEFLSLRRGFSEDRDNAQRRIDRAARQQGRSEWVGKGDLLRVAWPTMTLDQQRAVTNTVIDTVTVAPATRRGSVFDPERVNVTWKV